MGGGRVGEGGGKAGVGGGGAEEVSIVTHAHREKHDE